MCRALANKQAPRCSQVLNLLEKVQHEVEEPSAVPTALNARGM